MKLQNLQLLILLGASGLSVVVFWHRSLSWQSTAQQCLAKEAELEKQLSASEARLQEVELRADEETIRADNMQKRLSNEGAELILAQQQREMARNFLSACNAEKNKLKQQKIQELNQSENEKVLAIRDLRNTMGQLNIRMRDQCVHVAAGNLEEARKLCPADTIVEAEAPKQGQ